MCGQETPFAVINKGVQQAHDVGEALLLEQIKSFKGSFKKQALLRRGLGSWYK